MAGVPASGGAQDTTAQSGSISDAGYVPPHEPYRLPEDLVQLRDLLLDRLQGAQASEHRGELTIQVPPDTLIDALTLCRDDAAVRCELLSDVHAVHFPGGVRQEADQETTGWPVYTDVVDQGRIELNYVLRSLTHNLWFRLRAILPDDDGARIESATTLYSSANVMEREVYDMMGVVFEGHPNLTRIHMPEDWEGHPHRKDYPLGGVEVMYKGTTVAPPDERDY